jgi:hypothetical protein
MARRIGEARKQFTSTMKTELLLELHNKSMKSGIPMSKLLDKAVEMYLTAESVRET